MIGDITNTICFVNVLMIGGGVIASMEKVSTFKRFVLVLSLCIALFFITHLAYQIDF